jgi:hypothetical protein
VTHASTAARFLAAAVIAHCAIGATASAQPSEPARDESTASSNVSAGAAAPGARGILASCARAEAVVTGIVSQPKKVDLHGWVASLRVDGVPAGSIELGDTIDVAWEELSPSRPVRFADGERVLLVLEALPTQSLWRKRFPSADGARSVLVVANRGDAFLRKPDGATLGAFEHWLKLSSSARDATPGALRLAELVSIAPAGLASEALEMLDGRPQLAEQLGAEGASRLFAGMRDESRDLGIRTRTLELATRAGLPGVREAALTLTQPGSGLRAPAYRALASLPGGLRSDEKAKLLDDPEPSVRAAGAGLADDPALRPRLEAMLATDKSPDVRRAVGAALIARYGASAVDEVVVLLDDEDKGVRAATAMSIGALGADAVPALKRVVDGESKRAAFAAVLGLSHAGEEGAKEIFFIANSHQDESVRAFARLALGKAPGHEH